MSGGVATSTQVRLEGDFRLEWRPADRRSHLMAKGRAFLILIVIDATAGRVRLR